MLPELDRVAEMPTFVHTAEKTVNNVAGAKIKPGNAFQRFRMEVVRHEETEVKIQESAGVDEVERNLRVKRKGENDNMTSKKA